MGWVKRAISKCCSSHGKLRQTDVRSFALKYACFCVIGASGVVVDMAIFWILLHYASLPVMAIKVIASETALICNFLLNEFWTFRSNCYNQRRWKNRFARGIRFHAICGLGIILSVLLLLLQVNVLNVQPIFANFVAIVIVSFWNFFLNWKVNWMPKPAPEAMVS